MKFPFKVACLLLSLMLLLNAAGFAAMLGCDQECCQSSPRSVSTQSNSTSCHEGEEMGGQASDAALQVETRPAKAPPLNSFQCVREVASALFLTEKRNCRYDLVPSASLEQVLAHPKNHVGESAGYPSSPPLSQPITAPLRN